MVGNARVDDEKETVYPQIVIPLNHLLYFQTYTIKGLSDTSQHVLSVSPHTFYMLAVLFDLENLDYNLLTKYVEVP